MGKQIRILVTGATGFVGGNLSRVLIEQGYEVSCLVRDISKAENLKKIGARIVFGNILDQQSLTKAVGDIDIVFHLAGVLGNTKFTRREIHEINFDGTKKVFLAAQEAGVKQFIFVSTAFVLWSKDLKPTGQYAKSKYQTEQFLLKNSNSDIKITIVRPGFLYGPGCIGLAPLFKAVKTGRFFYIGDGRHVFELTYVGDLVYFLAGLIGDKRAYGETLVVSSPNPPIFKEFIEEIAGQFKVPVPRLHFPKTIAKILTKTLYLFELLNIHLPLSRSSFKTMAEPRRFDTSQTEKIFGYEPSTILKEGVARSIAYYLENKLI